MVQTEKIALEYPVVLHSNELFSFVRERGPGAEKGVLLLLLSLLVILGRVGLNNGQKQAQLLEI